MARPRRDGAPPAEPNRRKLSEIFLRQLKPAVGRPYVVWDTYQRGLAVVVQRTGSAAWKAVYSRNGRPRWFHIGLVGAIGLADARKLASRVMFAVAEGKDPAAERAAERGRGTFEELATRYLEEHAKKKNKSWKQADSLIRRYVLPRWAKLATADISRGDVKTMLRKIDAPISANQTLAAASAIFSWAIKEDLLKDNPCRGVARNETTDRERVLSDSEIPKFWTAFDDAGLLVSSALKVLLLTGQRLGEVRHMRWEHIEEGWWTLPGSPVPDCGWPGTKNGETHRVWIPEAAQAIIAELSEDEVPPKGGTGFVFESERGAAVYGLAEAMRKTCVALGVERATPHDLRRTHGTLIASLGFGRDAMNRIQNHREGGIASVYDRHAYAEENKRIMEAVAGRVMTLIDGGTPNVIAGRFPR
jgi:integrase